MAVGGVDTDYSLLVNVSRHWLEGAMPPVSATGGCVTVEHVVETRKLHEGELATGCCAQPDKACITSKHRALCGAPTRL
ncbi:hypothetical protein HaLaN_17114 [Haematococcus lacustris]|uniref:Uncharacterized protein n=1 Tax=Haematococcus lacustris TaxID=44745 RepID=A0A699ZDY9_HAELA|nr:hypothetical protein HaLaN_17114 [Haematococcus lacustris]